MARRRNPDIFKNLTNGVKDAGYILMGEAVTNAVPRMAGLPTTGPAGRGIEAAVAVAAGMAVDRMMTKKAGALVLASGLAVPLRKLLAGANIPVVSDALASGPGVSAYVQPGRRRALAAYVQPRRVALAGPSSSGTPCNGAGVVY